MQKSSGKTMDDDVKDLEKRFDRLEPRDASRSANLINTAKHHLSRGSGSAAVNKYKSDSNSTSPTLQEKKPESTITDSKSFVRSVIATVAAPIAYDTATFQEVMNQAKKDGGDDKKASNNTPANPKNLKEKSASSSTLRVGPFAAIRENEMKRKKKASLDLNPNEED